MLEYGSFLINWAHMSRIHTNPLFSVKYRIVRKFSIQWRSWILRLLNDFSISYFSRSLQKTCLTHICNYFSFSYDWTWYTLIRSVSREPGPGTWSFPIRRFCGAREVWNRSIGRQNTPGQRLPWEPRPSALLILASNRDFIKHVGVLNINKQRCVLNGCCWFIIQSLPAAAQQPFPRAPRPHSWPSSSWELLASYDHQTKQIRNFIGVSNTS